MILAIIYFAIALALLAFACYCAICAAANFTEFWCCYFNRSKNLLVGLLYTTIAVVVSFSAGGLVSLGDCAYGEYALRPAEKIEEAKVVETEAENNSEITITVSQEEVDEVIEELKSFLK